MGDSTTRVPVDRDLNQNRRIDDWEQELSRQPGEENLRLQIDELGYYGLGIYIHGGPDVGRFSIGCLTTCQVHVDALVDRANDSPGGRLNLYILLMKETE